MTALNTAAGRSTPSTPGHRHTGRRTYRHRIHDSARYPAAYRRDRPAASQALGESIPTCALSYHSCFASTIATAAVTEAVA